MVYDIFMLNIGKVIQKEVFLTAKGTNYVHKKSITDTKKANSMTDIKFLGKQA